jgi:hypothetical protein
MKKYLLSIMIMIMLICTLPIWSEDIKTVSDAEGLCASISADLFLHDYDSVVEKIRLNSAISESDLKQLRLMIETNLSVAEKNYGLCVGFEKLDNITVGKSLVKIITLQKFTKYAIKWEIVFYNSGVSWKIVNIWFDDKIVDLLKN